MNMRMAWVGALLGVALPGAAGAQTVESGPVKVRVTGYAQIQLNTTSVSSSDVGGDEVAFSTFETRRIRPVIHVTIADWITAQLQPDFALGDLVLQDAWINLGFDDEIQLRVGQFKKPFSAILLTSSTQILPIERGLRIRELDDAAQAVMSASDTQIFGDLDGDLIFGEQHQMLEAQGYLGRDLGAALHGELGRWSYNLGVFNGEGQDRRDRNDAKSFAGRITYAPAERLPLEIGLAGSYRETRLDGELNGEEVEGVKLAGSVVALDVEWGASRRPGWHLMAEAVTGENLALAENLWGVQAWLAYFRPLERPRLEGIEPLVRVSFGEPSTERGNDRGLLLTPGINCYFFSRNRLLLNWDVFLPESDALATQHAFRAQLQLYY